MKNNEQKIIIDELHIDSPPVLTGKIQHAFGKAAEYNLTVEEKNKGIADFKEFMNKNSSKISTSPKSPYSQYIISTTAFFGNFSKQFNSAFNTKKVGTFVYAHRKKIAQASLIACFVFIFAAGTATAANSSLPGDLLYPIKIKINEPIESALAVGPKEKAKVAVKHAVERVKEASELSLAGKISSENENAINTEITERSEEARRSIINLKTYGNADVADDITVDFENSVSIYKRNIEAFSKFNSNTEYGDKLKEVLNHVDEVIQKISEPRKDSIKSDNDETHRNNKDAKKIQVEYNYREHQKDTSNTTYTDRGFNNSKKYNRESESEKMEDKNNIETLIATTTATQTTVITEASTSASTSPLLTLPVETSIQSANVPISIPSSIPVPTPAIYFPKSLVQ